MKKALTILTIIILVSIAVSAVAEVVVTGDMRIRPRMDLREITDNPHALDTSSAVYDSTYSKTTQNDGYYYYRARINMKADIGDGWYSHVQLGTNGFAYWTGKFGDGDKVSSTSISTAGRGNVDFMLLYFGRKLEKSGYMLGVIPVNGLSNPLLDLHYYSNVMIDVPFFLYGNNGSHGFSGYLKLNNGGKINASVFVDENEVPKEIETIEYDPSADPDTVISSTKTDNELKDKYTLMLDAPLKFSDFTVQPVVMFTAIATDGAEKPMTYGANITTPTFGKFKFYGSIGASSQSEDGTSEYKAWYARLKTVGKIGKGKFTGWVDIAEKKYDYAAMQDYKRKFMYLWLAYEIPVYKSDVGSVSVKPTWRHISQKREDAGGVEYYEYTRDKIELTIDFKFK